VNTDVSRLLVCCALAALTNACETPTPTHLVFHQSTVLGVDASTSATQAGHTRIVVGYDRQTTAFIPKSSVDTSNSATNGTPPATPTPKLENEAMSAVSLSTIKIRGLGQTEVHERFATGEAAKNIARDAERMTAFTAVSPTPAPTVSPTPNGQ
jgi:hypothetical protein